MTYQTLENITDLGLKGLLNYPNLDTPIFYPLFLFSIFLIFASLSFFREVIREGKGNLLSSLAVSGYVTTSVAVILSVMGLIQTSILVTTVVVSIVFQALFLLTKKS